MVYPTIPRFPHLHPGIRAPTQRAHADSPLKSVSSSPEKKIFCLVKLDLLPLFRDDPWFGRKVLDEIIQGICIDRYPIEFLQLLKHLLAVNDSLALTRREIEFYTGFLGIPL